MSSIELVFVDDKSLSHELAVLEKPFNVFGDTNPFTEKIKHYAYLQDSCSTHKLMQTTQIFE